MYNIFPNHIVFGIHAQLLILIDHLEPFCEEKNVYFLIKKNPKKSFEMKSMPSLVKKGEIKNDKFFRY